MRLLCVVMHQARADHVLLTRPISEVIRSCFDGHTSFISQRHKLVYHWCKIFYQVIGVQVFYCVRVSKSGNSRFHARRILHSLGIIVIHKPKVSLEWRRNENLV